ncbi:MAG: putative holin [Burkholderiales bacterium]|jgi:hypothetical protein|nr:putative holin [Burkholderiales bacterium]
MKFLKAMLGELLSVVPRLSGWTLIAIVLTIGVALVKIDLLPITLYKLSLITLAGVSGYWFDRRVNKESRPSDFCRYSSVDPDAPPVIIDKELFIAAQLRRTIIIAAFVLGVCLGA